MIQIGGLVHEFDISKTQEEYTNSDSVLITDGHADSGDSTKSKNKIGIFTNGLHPFKAIIGKKVLWLDV